MKEMKRVLKLGGIACVATELILNNKTHREHFTPEELNDVILNCDVLTLVVGDLDFRPNLDSCHRFWG